MKMNKIAMSLVAMAFTAGMAHADTTTVNGGTVHFTGDLVNAACTVSTESADQTVNLGEYRTAEFQAAGDTITPVPFNIVLKDCDTSVAGTAAAAFYGQQDSTNPELLAVVSSDNSPTATGVGIQINDNASNVLKPDGSTFSQAQTLIDGDNTLHFSAQYVGTAAATAGQANADATFVMQYQ